MNSLKVLLPAERSRIIMEDLERMNLQPNVMITKEDLLQRLDSKFGGRTFDRDIATQLYDQMKKEKSGSVLISEFVRVFIQAQDFLVQNLLEAEQSLAEYNTAKLDVLKKLEALKSEEKLNPYGIINESILTVQVLELRNMENLTSNSFVAMVICGNVVLQTKPLQYSKGVEWNERFHIEIKTGSETIQIILMTYTSQNQERLVGQILFPVKNLSDQCLRDEWFDLQDERGTTIGGKIRLKLQWIHSKVKYLEGVIQVWEKKILTQVEDKEDFKRSLSMLNKLFPRAAASIKL